MQKILLLITLSLFSTLSFAQTTFTTVSQAEKYCPAIDALTFTPANAKYTNGSGVITGFNGVAFENIQPQKKVPAPKYRDNKNLLTDAQFRQVAGIYGYDNGVTTCFYSYTSVKDISVALVMRGD